jgi:hypothetical protein
MPIYIYINICFNICVFQLNIEYIHNKDNKDSFSTVITNYTVAQSA